jgi:hypothetical protein
MKNIINKFAKDLNALMNELDIDNRTHLDLQ